MIHILEQFNPNADWGLMFLLRILVKIFRPNVPWRILG